MGDFRKLRVWQAAQALAIDVHRVLRRIRAPKGSNLPSQLSRAVASVPSNIVEGSAHQSTKEFIRFLGYSLCSVSEVEGHLQLAVDLGMISNVDFTRLLTQVVDVRKMLHGLIKRLADDQA